MSTSVLPQLLAVDSELSEQATVLAAQLTELEEKRKGIQTVIAMFESGANVDMTALSAMTGTDTSESSSKASTEKTHKTPAKSKTTKAATKSAKSSTAKASATKTSTAKASATKTSTAKTSTAKTTKAKATRGRPAKAKAAAPSEPATAPSETTAKEKNTAAKRSGRTANWQRYVQENYRKSPLPDVIVGVLQAQPTNVFKIADVMNSVFKEDIPKNHFLKARNRISNILSAGARDGVWYRGSGGTYSMSEKAIKSS